MDTTKVKRMLARGTAEELQEIKRYCGQRIAELAKREREAIKKQTEASYVQAWEAIGKKAKIGMFILVSAHVKRVGLLQYGLAGERYAKAAYQEFKGGEIFRVVAVRPRLKTLWVAVDANMQLGFKPASLLEIGVNNVHLYPDELRANVAKVKLCGNELGPTYTGPSLGNGSNP